MSAQAKTSIKLRNLEVEIAEATHCITTPNNKAVDNTGKNLQSLNHQLLHHTNRLKSQIQSKIKLYNSQRVPMN